MPTVPSFKNSLSAILFYCDTSEDVISKKTINHILIIYNCCHVYHEVSSSAFEGIDMNTYVSDVGIYVG